jgi:hypothetical protein
VIESRKSASPYNRHQRDNRLSAYNNTKLEPDEVISAGQKAKENTTTKRATKQFD